MDLPQAASAWLLHPTALSHAWNRGNWFGPARSRADYNYRLSSAFSPLPRWRKQSQVSQARPPTSSDCHMERSGQCQERTAGLVGSWPGRVCRAESQLPSLLLPTLGTSWLPPTGHPLHLQFPKDFRRQGIWSKSHFGSWTLPGSPGPQWCHSQQPSALP